jgi:VanZ family protein
MLIKRLLEPNKFDLWLAVLWTSIIILLCFKAPAVEKEFYFPNADKLAHSIFYLTFVILWYRYMLFIGLKDKKHKVYLIVVAVLLGLVIELAQAFLTTTRQGDVLDAVANTIGCLLGIIVVNLVYKK